MRPQEMAVREERQETELGLNLKGEEERSKQKPELC